MRNLLLASVFGLMLSGSSAFAGSTMSFNGNLSGVASPVSLAFVVSSGSCNLYSQTNPSVTLDGAGNFSVNLGATGTFYGNSHSAGYASFSQIFDATNSGIIGDNAGSLCTVNGTSSSTAWSVQVSVNGTFLGSVPLNPFPTAISALTAFNAAGLGNKPVSSTPPTTNQVLQYDGVQWTPTTLSGTGLTNVTLTMPGTLFANPGAISTNGTYTWTLNNQSANQIFAGPGTGVPSAPTFRSLVVADLPTVDLAHGGTGATSQAAAAIAILPSQSGNSGKYLTTDGTNSSWATVAAGGGTLTGISSGAGITVTGTAPILTVGLTTPVSIANGGTGAGSLTANGVVLGGATSLSSIAPPGTAGQVLMSSAGTAAPTWQALSVTPGLANNNVLQNTSGSTFTMNNLVMTGMTGMTSLATLNSAILTSNPIGVPQWSTSLPASSGGTGVTFYTIGDLLYASTPTALSRLPAATSGTVLTSNGVGTAPTWQMPSGAPLTAAVTLSVMSGGSDTLCNGSAMALVASQPNCAFATLQGALAKLPSSINAPVTINIGSNITTSTPDGAIVFNQNLGPLGTIYVNGNGYTLTNNDIYIFGVLIMTGGLNPAPGANPTPSLVLHNMTFASSGSAMMQTVTQVTGVVQMDNVNISGGVQSMGGIMMFTPSVATSITAPTSGNNCQAISVTGGGQVQFQGVGSVSVSIPASANGCTAVGVSNGGSVQIQAPMSIGGSGGSGNQTGFNVSTGGTVQIQSNVSVALSASGNDYDVQISQGGYFQIGNGSTLTLAVSFSGSSASGLMMSGGAMDIGNNGSGSLIINNASNSNAMPVQLFNGASINAGMSSSFQINATPSNVNYAGLSLDSNSSFSSSGLISIKGNPAISISNLSKVSLSPSSGTVTLTAAASSPTSVVSVSTNSVFKFSPNGGSSASFSTSSPFGIVPIFLVSKHSTVDFEPQSTNGLSFNSLPFASATDKSLIFLQGSAAGFSSSSTADSSSTYNASAYPTAPQATVASCPPTFSSLAGICYKSTGSATFGNAAASCAAIKSHLCTLEEDARMCATFSMPATTNWTSQIQGITPYVYTAYCSSGNLSFGYADPTTTGGNGFCCLN